MIACKPKKCGSAEERREKKSRHQLIKRTCCHGIFFFSLGPCPCLPHRLRMVTMHLSSSPHSTPSPPRVSSPATETTPPLSNITGADTAHGPAKQQQLAKGAMWHLSFARLFLLHMQTMCSFIVCTTCKRTLSPSPLSLFFSFFLCTTTNTALSIACASTGQT